MKGYGLPRNDDVANPDKDDILTYALSGFKEEIRNKTTKAQRRRFFKRKARKQGRTEIQEQLEMD